MKINKQFHKEHGFTVNCPNCNIEQIKITVPWYKLPMVVQDIIFENQYDYQVVQCPKCKEKAIQFY